MANKSTMNQYLPTDTIFLFIQDTLDSTIHPSSTRVASFMPVAFMNTISSWYGHHTL